MNWMSTVQLRATKDYISRAESFYSLEGNMCGTAMRGAVALPGSKATSRAKGLCAYRESRDVLEALAALMRPLTTDAARVRRLVTDADDAGFQFDD